MSEPMAKKLKMSPEEIKSKLMNLFAKAPKKEDKPDVTLDSDDDGDIDSDENSTDDSDDDTEPIKEETHEKDRWYLCLKLFSSKKSHVAT